jgi:hypothetical protein
MLCSSVLEMREFRIEAGESLLLNLIGEMLAPIQCGFSLFSINKIPNPGRRCIKNDG